MTNSQLIFAVCVASMFSGCALAALVGEVARWAKGRGVMQSIELSNNKGKF